MFVLNGPLCYPGNSLPSQREVPPGFWTLGFSMQMGYYLERADEFKMPDKLYGDIESQARKVITTFESRDIATGALFEGVKGSGKSLLLKKISNDLASRYPIIMISQPHRDSGFLNFLSSIPNPVVLVFDEFEKTYNAEHQKELLSLFDGVFSKKRLYLLTINDYRAVNSLFLNRPGRIYYRMVFDGLEDEFIADYLDDRLERKHRRQALDNYIGCFQSITFDCLSAIVEEVNRYDEDPFSLTLLNVQPETSSYMQITSYIDGERVGTGSFPGHPAMHEVVDVSFNVSTFHLKGDGEADRYMDDFIRPMRFDESKYSEEQLLTMEIDPGYLFELKLLRNTSLSQCGKTFCYTVYLLDKDDKPHTLTIDVRKKKKAQDWRSMGTIASASYGVV